MNRYRTHTCGALRKEHTAQESGSQEKGAQKSDRRQVRLSGWLHRKRDHGNLLFLDLRDRYGITQCVIEQGTPLFNQAEALKLETVLSVLGEVVLRSDETRNPALATGEVELRIQELEILGQADPLPLQVNSDEPAGEEVRLRYRYLDLRRAPMQERILLRNAVIQSIRRRMVEQGFSEFQTPILTAASPEGARDYLVPSRLHPNKFYALPQAPQIFKQLLMIAGFDKYFQIAPCFRDEDARADRSPGEFYQLDFEMSFVEQEDIFAALEPVLHGVFEEFAPNAAITPAPFPRIAYGQAMTRYGSDKPDLRNPLELCEVADIFSGSGFRIFAEVAKQGGIVRALRAPQAARRPRSFFDRLNDWAREIGANGLGYLIYDDQGTGQGPIARNLEPDRIEALAKRTDAQPGDALFFIAGEARTAAVQAGLARDEVARRLDETREAKTPPLIEQNAFRFCWITDFPMYEPDPETGKVRFSHNPFSMPQGGLEALNGDPLSVLAYQYDIVCNGTELSSGAIRNHVPEIMLKAFEIAGYQRKDVEEQFTGILSALRFGAPPHGGSAPGIDRIVMLLANTTNLREVVAFPMNQRAEDLMMHAPAEITPERLRELHLRPAPPPPTTKDTTTKNTEN